MQVGKLDDRSTPYGPVSPAPPHKIVMFPDIQPATSPSDIEPQKRLNDQEII